MTYHLTVHTITVPMSKKTNELITMYLTRYYVTMTVCLNYELEMLRSLKTLYKYTDRFVTIFSLVDASSRLNRKRSGNL